MKKLSRHEKHITVVSAILVVMILVSSFFPFSAEAREIRKKQRSYEIAVVFDNSGSMYEGMAWCRAKYAMEIFASMLSYENGDKLRIFPMWGVTVDGSMPENGGSYAPVEINSKDDINKISNMYTIRAKNTPFAPVWEARDYLKKSKASEKWIIVMTDGVFNEEQRGEFTGEFPDEELRKRLIDVASSGTKVQYLGFAEASNLKDEPSKGFFSKKSTDQSLKNDLIDICNAIFQRSELPKNRIHENEIDLDLSMGNLIVFAQGENASIGSLKDSSGTEIPKTLDSGQRKYSSISAGKRPNAGIDRTLAGQVVTFGECAKGKYSIELNGVDRDKIRVFYEPDVDVDITLTNSDGTVIDGKGDIPAGTYTLNSRIIDNKTGEDVTKHELMGNSVTLETTVKTKMSDGTENEQKIENGAVIEMKPETEVGVYIVGTYLKDYTVTSDGNPSLEWLKFLKPVDPTPPPFTFEVKAEVLQSQSWYKKSDIDNWLPVRVFLTADGNPLSEELMSALRFFAVSDGVKCRWERVAGQSAYDVHLARDENGQSVYPGEGRFKLTASASTVDEYEREYTGESTVSFEIQKYSKVWRILIWILAFLAVVILWLLFMLKKVMPKKLKKGNNAKFSSMTVGKLDSSFINVSYSRRGRTLTVSTNTTLQYDENCDVTLTLKPIDNRFTPSRRRRVAIVGIRAMGNDGEFSASGTTFINYNGAWVPRDQMSAVKNGTTPKPVEKKFTSHNFSVSVRRANGAVLVCEITTG